MALVDAAELTYGSCGTPRYSIQKGPHRDTNYTPLPCPWEGAGTGGVAGAPDLSAAAPPAAVSAEQTPLLQPTSGPIPMTGACGFRHMRKGPCGQRRTCRLGIPRRPTVVAPAAVGGHFGPPKPAGGHFGVQGKGGEARVAEEDTALLDFALLKRGSWLMGLAVAAAAVLSFLGFIFWAMDSDIRAYGMAVWWEMWFWSGEMAALAVCLGFVNAGWYLARRHAFLSMAFFLLEETPADLGFITWGLVGLLVSARIVSDHAVSARLDRFHLIVLALFSISCAVHVLERLWIYRVHRDIYEAQLAHLVGAEKVLCHLTYCKPENAALLCTPRDPAHTHDVGSTLRALLSSSMTNVDADISVETQRRGAADRAHDIMLNLDPLKRGWFDFDDVRSVVSSDGEADVVWDVVAGVSGNLKRVDHDRIANCVFDVSSERQRLYNILHERSELAKILHMVLQGVMCLVGGIVVLLMLDVDLMSLMLPAASLLLSASFIFGNVFASAFQSLVFVFAVRPFALGDRVSIDGGTTVLIVGKIRLLVTEFFEPSGQMHIIPNSLLFSRDIQQYRRSRSHCTTASIDIDARHLSVFAEFKARLRAQLEADTHFPWDLDNNFMVWIDSMKRQRNVVTIKIWVGLTDVTWQTPVVFLGAQSALYAIAEAILLHLNAATYAPPPQPVDLGAQTITQPPAQATAQAAHLDV